MNEPMTKGWRRPTKKHSDAYQLDRLADAGVKPEDTEVEWSNVPHKALRPGDTLAVVALHLLAQDEPTFLNRCHDLAGCGASILDLSTGRSYDPASLAAFPAVKDAWKKEKNTLDKQRASTIGKLGGAKPKLPKGSPAYKLAAALIKSGGEFPEYPKIISALWDAHKVDVSKKTLMRLRDSLKPKAK